jgi:hypothetical protein
MWGTKLVDYNVKILSSEQSEVEHKIIIYRLQVLEYNLKFSYQIQRLGSSNAKYILILL